VRAIVESRAGRRNAGDPGCGKPTRFLGYSVESFKLWAFVFSAIVAGIAGALYVRRSVSSTQASLRHQFNRSRHLGCSRGRARSTAPSQAPVLVNYCENLSDRAFPEVCFTALGRCSFSDDLSAAGLLPLRAREE